MTLHDAREGASFNQMLLELCFSVTLHDEGGVPIKRSWSNAFL